MQNGSFTILYGQIVDFNQMRDSHGNEFANSLSRYETVVNSLTDTYGKEIAFPSEDTIKVVFNRPENALQYAFNLFSSFAKEPRIPYRIGISSGNADGNQADIAQYLSQICSEGAVLVSKALVDSVDKDAKHNFHFIGNTLLKNYNIPLDVYCLLEKGLYVPTQYELTIKSKNRNSIAVLPFHNTSSEKELDHICDGLAEEVIDRLTQTNELNVTARSSSFLFKNREVSILEISRKLNVSYILDGSVRKRNNEYRISYQLIDAATGYNILSNSISSSFENLYDSERRISEDIFGQFSINRTNDSTTKEYYLDPDAYDYYLKGKHFAYMWTEETSQEAIRYYKKALEIVPDYSLALAGLSTCLMHCAVSGYIDPKQGYEQALMYADKAISADSSLHEGYVSKALVTFLIGNWYLPDFELNLNKALQISPCNSEIRMFNGMLFLYKGDKDRALIELKLAKSLDPYSVPVVIRLGLVQYLRNEYEDAYNTLLTILDKPNCHAYSSFRLAWCCIQLKQYDRALKYLDEAKNDHAYFNLIYSTYLVVHFLLKNEDKFYHYKSIIESQDKEDITYNYNHAILNKLLGNPDRSIYYLEKTLQDLYMRYALIHFDIFWEEYWDMPAFQKIIDDIYSLKNKGILRIESDTKEYFDLNVNEFLYAEAQDNYTLIVYKEGKYKREKILRATLSAIENQLNRPEIFRCHRSFLVNTDIAFHYNKTDNKAHLKHSELDITIPISRSKEKEIKALIKN